MQENTTTSLKRIRVNEPESDTFNPYVLWNDAVRAVNYTENLREAAANLVKSIDNWKNVQPVNAQVQQDVELLRKLL